MKNFSHLTAENAVYLDELQNQYKTHPESVPQEWQYFFEGVEFSKKLNGAVKTDIEHPSSEYKVLQLIQAYREFGHLKAKVDPLGRVENQAPMLELDFHGFSESNLDTVYQVTEMVLEEPKTLSSLIEHLNNTYCQTLVVQMADLSFEMRNWLYQKFEKQKPYKIQEKKKKEVFDLLNRGECLERFLHTRFVGAKRFSLEGSESLIPMLHELVKRGAKSEVTDLVLGMAHRGRLNVLSNFMGKAFSVMLAEFEGIEHEGHASFTGDVKYHLGYSADKKFGEEHKVHLSLAFNPSHLEAVNPVVEGISWVKQRKNGDGKKKVVPVLIHGDAAFIGQGVVSETLQMSKLRAYNTGGTIHIVVDNQVGFTTDPDDTRSSCYSSDVVKPLSIPIFHVNGDDVEACIKAARMALEFRQTFHSDVVIRLVSYRRHGHNEGDEPSFTQPVLYKKIKSHPTVREIYAEKLETQKVLSSGEAQKIWDLELERLQGHLDEIRKNPPNLKMPVMDGFWKEFKQVGLDEFRESVKTSISKQDLDKLLLKILTEPKHVNIHPKLKTLLSKKLKNFKENQTLDWGTAELLAYASLLNEGTSIRLTGQDTGRGTFSHRHAVYHDMKTGDVFSFLKNINPEAQLDIHNSHLSEYAALGFEYGVSTADPHRLTIWEAQFGDFVNGAQIIIDQFISSGEQKWQRLSGLVMFLPHGYEGQGPEHSSARLERFLQLCAEANMQVCNLTTPSQIFHVLRRQMKRSFRKPLIIMTPKSLLRHPRVVSHVTKFTEDQFYEAFDDPNIKDPGKVQRALLCSGKIYYELLQEQISDPNGQHVAILRVEQIYPFPYDELVSYLKPYKNLKELFWVQEEPENMGALGFLRLKLTKLKNQMGKPNLSLGYVARPERSSPAAGSPHRHKIEQEEILKKGFAFKKK